MLPSFPISKKDKKHMIGSPKRKKQVKCSPRYNRSIAMYKRSRERSREKDKEKKSNEK